MSEARKVEIDLPAGTLFQPGRICAEFSHPLGTGTVSRIIGEGNGLSGYEVRFRTKSNEEHHLIENSFFEGYERLHPGEAPHDRLSRAVLMAAGRLSR